MANESNQTVEPLTEDELAEIGQALMAIDTRYGAGVIFDDLTPLRAKIEAMSMQLAKRRGS